MFDHTATFVPNSIQVVLPDWQPMSLDDVMKNLYREVVDPNAAYSYRGGVGNFLVASTAVAGELVKYGVQNIMHSVNHIQWVPETLGAMASTVDLLVVDPVKWLIKSEFEANCSKEQLSEFSRRYNELPSSSRLLAEMLGDGAILGGTVKIFDIANSVVKIPSKPLLAIEYGTTSGIGEISAISEVGKTGAALGNKISMVGGIFEEVEGLGKSIENVGSSSIWSS